MNDQELDRRVRKDTERVQKDLRVLAKDVAARVSSFQESVAHTSGKANKEVTRQLESSISNLSKGFEETTGDAAKVLADTSNKLQKVVGKRFDYFSKKAEAVVDTTGDAAKVLADTSAKVQKVVGKRFNYFSKKAEAVIEIPKNFGKKRTRFPVVLVSLGLAVGFLLGVIFLPNRQPVEPVSI